MDAPVTPIFLQLSHLNWGVTWRSFNAFCVVCWWVQCERRVSPGACFGSTWSLWFAQGPAGGVRNTWGRWHLKQPLFPCKQSTVQDLRGLWGSLQLRLQRARAAAQLLPVVLVWVSLDHPQQWVWMCPLAVCRQVKGNHKRMHEEGISRIGSGVAQDCAS